MRVSAHLGMLRRLTRMRACGGHRDIRNADGTNKPRDRPGGSCGVLAPQDFSLCRKCDLRYGVSKPSSKIASLPLQFTSVKLPGVPMSPAAEAREP